MNISDTDLLSLQSHPAFKEINGLDRKKVMSFALATALITKLPLPTVAVDNKNNYYQGNCFTIVSAIANQFNEKIVVDYDTVVNFTKNVWSARYFTLHNDLDFINYGNHSFFDSLFGVNNFISDEDYQFVNQFKESILTISNVIKKLIK